MKVTWVHITPIDAETPHSLKKRIVSSNNVIYFPGYLCQIINNMAQKKTEVLVLTYKLDVKEMMIDIFCWFDKNMLKLL